MERLKHPAVLAAEACADLANQAMDERDSLRAEVEVYKRAMKVLATRLDDKEDCIEMGDCPYPAVPWATPNRDEVLSESCVKCLTAWAISEAGKDKEGEG